MRLIDSLRRPRPMRFPQPPKRPRPDHLFLPLFLTLLCIWFSFV